MCTLDSFRIDLKGLEESTTALDFHLTDEYFAAIEASEIRRGDLSVALSIRKAATLFELDFHIEGHVCIPCDLCLDDMEQPIATDNRLLARFGDTSTEQDDVVVVGEEEGILDVAWLIYEFIDLAIPIKHVHTPGNCNAAMTRKLEELSATRSGDGAGEEAVDPRWEALRNLRN